MRNYIDPEMNIAMFESESVVVTNSTNAQANSFFDTAAAGAKGSQDSWAAATVEANNILDFTK